MQVNLRVRREDAEDTAQAETTNLQWPRDLSTDERKKRHSKRVSVVALELLKGNGAWFGRR